MVYEMVEWETIQMFCFILLNFFWQTVCKETGTWIYGILSFIYIYKLLPANSAG